MRDGVYFSTTLVVAAVLLVSNLRPATIGSVLSVGALAVLGYLAYARAHPQWRKSNLPAVDWVWYVALPIMTFLLLLVAGIGLVLQSTLSMYGVALALILLLVIGIRNAWDLIIWMVQHEPKSGGTKDDK